MNLSFLSINNDEKNVDEILKLFGFISYVPNKTKIFCNAMLLLLNKRLNQSSQVFQSHAHPAQ